MERALKFQDSGWSWRLSRSISVEWGREGRGATTCQTSLLSQALVPSIVFPSWQPLRQAKLFTHLSFKNMKPSQPLSFLPFPSTVCPFGRTVATWNIASKHFLSLISFWLIYFAIKFHKISLLNFRGIYSSRSRSGFWGQSENVKSKKQSSSG